VSDETPRALFEYGPYVQVACFCDMILEGKDGTFSAIRIIDTLTHTEARPDPPNELPAFSLPLQLLLLLKSGSAQGRRTVEIRPIKPNGEALSAVPFPAHFEGEERGIAIQARIQMVFDLEGLYQFDVCIDGAKLTSIPVRVKYNPIRTAVTN